MQKQMVDTNTIINLEKNGEVIDGQKKTWRHKLPIFIRICLVSLKCLIYFCNLGTSQQLILR
jgi:hypothetical protein